MLNSNVHGINMLIIVKMPTVVDILTFISMINEKFECFKQEKKSVYLIILVRLMS